MMDNIELCIIKAVPIISQSSLSIWMKSGILLRIAGLIYLIPILSCPSNIQGREPYMQKYDSSTQIKQKLACIQTFIDGFISNLAWWQKPLNSTLRYLFRRPWPSLRSQLYEKSTNCAVTFSQIVQSILMKFQLLVFYAHAKLFSRHWHSRERTLLTRPSGFLNRFLLNLVWCVSLPSFRHIPTDLFKTWYDVRHTLSQQNDSTLVTLASTHGHRVTGKL